jgi:hypothetical protein
MMIYWQFEVEKFTLASHEKGSFKQEFLISQKYTMNSKIRMMNEK